MSRRPFDYAKTPFPWFGGKTDAAPHVWAALGDVPHYVEPFFGGGAVLLRRPHPANRTYYSETVNDLDGLLTNFWRSVQLSPEETAVAASWPVSEADKSARGCAILREGVLDGDRLAGDPSYHDPVVAGWWVWSVCVTIGAFGAGGPWWPDDEGRLVKRPRARPGIKRETPHLGDNGKGVNAPQLREPGISRQMPHLGDDGRGVNHAGLREPGAAHPHVMPRLLEWFHHLAARLRHVRILHGDWSRALGNGATKTLPVRQNKGPAGIFLDPPYTATDRDTVYRPGHENFTIATDVERWAIDHGDDPQLRIVIAGYDGDYPHLETAGWSSVEWFTKGHLKGGYGNGTDDGNQQHRERLWMSPHCLQPEPDRQATLFDVEDS